ncbi:MAG: hypothetical protein ACTHMW_13765 [Actinomycetes bacterium]
MAAADDDLERLLREVDASLGEGRTASGSRSPSTGPNAAASPTVGGRLSRRGRRAPARGEEPAPLSRVGQSAVAGGVAAVPVFVAFALLPFLRAGSGAAGAFVGAFAAWLLATLLRR